jgi:hypothetical protein
VENEHDLVSINFTLEGAQSLDGKTDLNGIQVYDVFVIFAQFNCTARSRQPSLDSRIIQLA